MNIEVIRDGKTWIRPWGDMNERERERRESEREKEREIERGKG